MLKYVHEQVLKTPRNLSDYIKFRDTPLVIAREQSPNWSQFYVMRTACLNEGTPMTPPAIFLPYRNDVIEAAAGGVTLLDGRGRRVSRKDAQQLAHCLTKDCWVFLDAQFSENKQGKKFITYTRLRDNRLEEITELLQWDKGIKDGNLVDLVWNKQGMPVKKSGSEEEFDAEKNLYVWQPVAGSVPRFWSVADGAGLSCGRDPQVSYGRFGTFVCAAGAQKFSGRSKSIRKAYDNFSNLGGELQ